MLCFWFWRACLYSWCKPLCENFVPRGPPSEGPTALVDRSKLTFAQKGGFFLLCLFSGQDFSFLPRLCNILFFSLKALLNPWHSKEKTYQPVITTWGLKSSGVSLVEGQSLFSLFLPVFNLFRFKQLNQKNIQREKRPPVFPPP